MDVHISTLKERDINDITDMLLDMYMQHTKSYLISRNNLQSIPVENYVKKTIQDPNQVFLLAKVNNEVAGVIRCELKKTPSFYKESKEAYIDDLVVVKKYRRKGVATKLIRSCIKWGIKKGVKLFSCKVWEFNKPSARLFEAAGFQKDFSFYSYKTET